nr:hypothetical protein [Tanacetum cinerariifolium]
MLICSENVEDLKRENEKLTQMRGSVVVAAKEKGDGLKESVEEWAVDIESHISEAKEVIDWGEENANKTCFIIMSIMVEDIEDNGVASIVASSSSSRTISKHFLSSDAS